MAPPCTASAQSAEATSVGLELSRVSTLSGFSVGSGAGIQLATDTSGFATSSSSGSSGNASLHAAAAQAAADTWLESAPSAAAADCISPAGGTSSSGMIVAAAAPASQPAAATESVVDVAAAGGSLLSMVAPVLDSEDEDEADALHYRSIMGSSAARSKLKGLPLNSPKGLYPIIGEQQEHQSGQLVPKILSFKEHYVRLMEDLAPGSSSSLLNEGITFEALDKACPNLRCIGILGTSSNIVRYLSQQCSMPSRLAAQLTEVDGQHELQPGITIWAPALQKGRPRHKQSSAEVYVLVVGSQSAFTRPTSSQTFNSYLRYSFELCSDLLLVLSDHEAADFRGEAYPFGSQNRGKVTTFRLVTQTNQELELKVLGASQAEVVGSPSSGQLLLLPYKTSSTAAPTALVSWPEDPKLVEVRHTLSVAKGQLPAELQQLQQQYALDFSDRFFRRLKKLADDGVAMTLEDILKLPCVQFLCAAGQGWEGMILQLGAAVERYAEDFRGGYAALRTGLAERHSFEVCAWTSALGAVAAGWTAVMSSSRQGSTNSSSSNVSPPLQPSGRGGTVQLQYRPGDGHPMGQLWGVTSELHNRGYTLWDASRSFERAMDGALVEVPFMLALADVLWKDVPKMVLFEQLPNLFPLTLPLPPEVSSTVMNVLLEYTADEMLHEAARVGFKWYSKVTGLLPGVESPGRQKGKWLAAARTRLSEWQTLPVELDQLKQSIMPLIVKHQISIRVNDLKKQQEIRGACQLQQMQAAYINQRKSVKEYFQGEVSRLVEAVQQQCAAVAKSGSLTATITGYREDDPKTVLSDDGCGTVERPAQSRLEYAAQQHQSGAQRYKLLQLLAAPAAAVTASGTEVSSSAAAAPPPAAAEADEVVQFSLSPNQQLLLAQPIATRAGTVLYVVSGLTNGSTPGTFIYVSHRNHRVPFTKSACVLELRKVLTGASFDPATRLLMLDSADDKLASLYLFDEHYQNLPRKVDEVKYESYMP